MSAKQFIKRAFGVCPFPWRKQRLRKEESLTQGQTAKRLNQDSGSSEGSPFQCWIHNSLLSRPRKVS